MKRDIMVDLETLDNTPTSAIIAIGAVMMDLEELAVDDWHFYQAINIDSAIKHGTVGGGTVSWWMRQDDDARKVFQEGGRPLDVVLKGFSSWALSFDVSRDELRVWGNGAAFDNTILANAYRATGQRMPWMYWNDRCYRTVKTLHPHIDMHRVGTYHNAKDDALSQALHLIDIQRAINSADII
jgi:exodeoxyribonuclease VIII